MTKTIQSEAGDVLVQADHRGSPTSYKLCCGCESNAESEQVRLGLDCHLGQRHGRPQTGNLFEFPATRPWLTEAALYEIATDGATCLKTSIPPDDASYRHPPTREYQHTALYKAHPRETLSSMAPEERRALTWWGITPRQRQIVQLICEGLTSVQIAERLGISARTVGAHRFNLMRRLQVRNVAGLIRAAIADGLIAPPLRTKR